MKYELDFNDCKIVDGTEVYRIIALKDFENVKAGDLLFLTLLLLPFLTS